MEETRKRKQNETEFPKSLEIMVKSSKNPDYIIWNLSYIDELILKIRNSTYNPLLFPTLEKLLVAPSTLKLTSGYKPMPGWPLTPQGLAENQQKLNNAIIKSSHQTDLDQSINTKQWHTFDIMLSIEYLKTFQFYQLLTFNDQIVLAKHVTVIIQSMTFAFTSFQYNADCFKTPDGCFVDIRNTMNLFDFITGGEMKKNNTILRNHLKSSQNVMGFLIREKLTNTEYILLKAIAICDPIFELSEEGRKIVWETRQTFSKTLFKYCETEYGKRNGPSRFATLLSYINLIIYHQKSLQKFLTILKTHFVFKMPQAMFSLEDSVLNINN
ncbi:unnamed protein product [Caenorhabditis angaria]|uniref:NR LBD domain-containing protein n=1 Tax=Caenorhabditis angaria TaxID=860376 RepID=A0A9P1IVQ2_9PELO|nr:unnamed protein product [Caenorhabditis angaria]